MLDPTRDFLLSKRSIMIDEHYKIDKAKFEKLRSVAQIVEHTALGIAGINSEAVKYAYLLKKKIFPDRSMPHPLKRRRKQEAWSAQKMKAIRTALSVSNSAIQLAVHMSTPLPKYEPSANENGIVGERGPEMIIDQNGKVNSLPQRFFNPEF